MVCIVMRPVVIVLIYYIAPMLTVRVLVGVSQDMKVNDAKKVKYAYIYLLNKYMYMQMYNITVERTNKNKYR